MRNATVPKPRPTGPRLFLDSADTAAWERLLPTGIFHGVTTNPLLLERAGVRCDVATLGALARKAAVLGAHEIHLQAWGDDEDALVRTGEALAATAPGATAVLVKVPATVVGLRAAARLKATGCAITLTAVYNQGQLLAAAALGAAYAAPYLGRLDDAGRDGHETVGAMHEILKGTGATTRLLVASLRGVEHVTELARRGLDTFTFGPDVAAALVTDSLTEEAAAAFEAAARRAGAA